MLFKCWPSLANSHRNSAEAIANLERCPTGACLLGLYSGVLLLDVVRLFPRIRVVGGGGLALAHAASRSGRGLVSLVGARLCAARSRVANPSMGPSAKVARTSKGG